MKLVVLVDNNTFIDRYYYGEPAVSYYIEDNDKKILLDVGYSDLYLRNAKNFGIQLNSIDVIVISHGHDDHTGGLPHYFLDTNKYNVEIVTHPEAFEEKWSDDGIKICSPLSKESLISKCKLSLSRTPKKISDNIIFLGEIPQSNDFEMRNSIGKRKVDDVFYDDYVLDDSALVYKGEKGLYIITGCSHSGICNIIEYAKQVCNNNNILGIIGGFHLFDFNNRCKKTIEYFKTNNIKELYPCHCTSFEVKSKIHEAIKIKEVGVGLEINWR